MRLKNFSLFKDRLSQYNKIYFDLRAKFFVIFSYKKRSFTRLCLSKYITSYRESNIYSVGLQYSDNFKDDFKIDYQYLMILFKLNLKID